MKKCILFPCILLFLLFYSCKNTSTDPAQEKRDFINISNVSIDSLTGYVKDLSGENPVFVNGHSFTILSRYYTKPGNNQAADYIAAKLKGFGLKVSNQIYSPTGRNVIALQDGSSKDNFVIICAHYDSRPDSSLAPGADDNASGVAAVLEAARLISKLKPAYSVLYAFWDEEEIMDRYGSTFFADSAAKAKMNIKCVLNVDMIGYDSNDDGIIALWPPSDNRSEEYVNMVMNANMQHSLDLTIIKASRAAPSDDYSFFQNGFKSLAIGEKCYFTPKDTLSDLNEYGHTPNDRLDKFNMKFFEKASKLVIAAAAKMNMLD